MQVSYEESRRRTLSLKRIKPRHYNVLCDAGHNYGMINAPQRDSTCCVWAMAEALLYEVEHLTEGLEK